MEENCENIEVRPEENTTRTCESKKYKHLPEEADKVKRRRINEQINKCLTLTEIEKLKQSFDDSVDNVGTDGSRENNDVPADRVENVKSDRYEETCKDNDQSSLVYGTHETQISEGEEAELHKHLIGCKKNPGHTHFVPVNEFNISHLPEGYHDNNLVMYIKAKADLTVRVGVKMTSTKRPEFWAKTTVPYAFYNMRGSDVMRIGTGMVWNVNKWTEEDGMGTCQCQKCQRSDAPRRVWGQVSMRTATHVVFDGLEARHTTCRLFYDRQDSPLVTLDGWITDVADIDEDRCILNCVICDLDVLDKLYKMWWHWWDLWKKVNNKYESSRDKGKLIFIVSHPHGCPKQVSVGHWINRYVVRGDWTKYTYTTCTCPGSSGAHVNPLGYNDDLLYDHHVHSGVNSEGQNFSGAGRDIM